MSDPEISREDLENFIVRQRKLIEKLKAEVGNLVAIKAEHQIIIDDLQEENKRLSAPQPESPKQEAPAG